MDLQFSRIRKEARAMFWPWCAVIFAGVLTWLRPYGSQELWLITTNTFLIAIPLRVFVVMSHSSCEPYGRSHVRTPANMTAHQGQNIARASLRILENCRSIQRLLVSRRRDKDFLQCQGFGS